MVGVLPGGDVNSNDFIERVSESEKGGLSKPSSAVIIKTFGVRAAAAGGAAIAG